MIKQLDDASRPAGEVEVLQVSGDVSSESIRRALEAFGAKTGAKVETTPANPGRGRGPQNEGE